MATYHVNPVTGNNANNGLTWATAWQTFGGTGLTAARHTPGDFVKVAKSPDPINTGLTYSVGPSFGSVTIARSVTGLTFTSPSVGQTWRISTALFSTGDIVRVSTSGNTPLQDCYTVNRLDANTIELVGSISTATSLASQAIQNYSVKAVQLSGTPYQLLWDNDTAWTVSNGATNTPTSQNVWQTNTNRLNFPASPALNTTYATRNLSAITDLSAFTRLSFMFQTTSVIPANAVKIVLCSGLNGTSPVAEAFLPATNSPTQPYIATGQGTPIVLDFGGPLPNNVQSIAIASGTTLPTASGNLTFINPVACKAATQADAITHRSLIGSNDSRKAWYPVRWLSPRGHVIINGQYGNTSTEDNLVWHVEETGVYNLFTLQTFVTFATSNAPNIQQMNENAVPGSPTVIEGGWDPVSDTKNGLTVYENFTPRIGGFVGGTMNWYQVRNFGIARYQLPANMLSTLGVTLDFEFLSGTTLIDVSGVNLLNFSAKTMVSGLAIVSGCNRSNVNIGLVGANGGFTIQGNNNVVKIDQLTGSGNFISFNANTYDCELNMANIKLVGATAPFNDVFRAGATTSNHSADKLNVPVTATSILESNTTWAPTTQVDSRVAFTRTQFSDQYVEAAVVTDGGTLWLGETFGETGGKGWRARITNNTRMAAYPLSFPLGRIALKANQTVTIALRMKNDTTNHTAQLFIDGGKINGVDNEVTSTATSSTAWQTVSVTITPTENGVIEPRVRMWLNTGSSAVLNFDRMTVS